MRPGPINLSTSGATPKLLVVDFRKRFESLNYFDLGNPSQQRIAAEASCEWSDGPKELKTANDLDGLFFRVLRSRAISMSNDRVHKQATITGQKCAIFANHQIEQLPVIGLLAIGDIKAEEAKVTGERA